MSAIYSGNMSGSFTQPATAAPVFLPFSTGVDFITTYNVTNASTYAANAIVSATWSLGSNGALFTNGTGLQVAWNNNGGGAAAALVSAPLAAGRGFFSQDTTISLPGAPVATTAVTNVATPVVATGSTAGLVAGSIVRIYNQLGALQLDGIDFTVGTVVTDTSFTLSYMQAIVGTVLAGQYRIIPFSPFYYPSTRVITQVVTSALIPGMTDVTLSVTHNYVVGQTVRFVIPTVNSTKFGLPTLNNRSATIIAVSPGGADGTAQNIVTVDINFVSLGGVFAWPLTTDPGFTPPQLVPYGANTPVANANNVTNYLDAVVNSGQRGLLLMPTITSNVTGLASNGPAGYNGQTVYWTAGKSINT